jgi:hypothetical protein
MKEIASSFSLAITAHVLVFTQSRSGSCCCSSAFDESFTERSFQFISAKVSKKLISSRFFIFFLIKICSEKCTAAKELFAKESSSETA